MYSQVDDSKKVCTYVHSVCCPVLQVNSSVEYTSMITVLQNLAGLICIFQMVPRYANIKTRSNLLLYRVELFYCRYVETIICPYCCQIS